MGLVGGGLMSWLGEVVLEVVDFEAQMVDLVMERLVRVVEDD